LKSANEGSLQKLWRTSGWAKGKKRATDRWHDAIELKWAARHWATRAGVKVPQIHIRKMTRKWASISMEGRLTLNSELLELPTPTYRR